MICVNLGNPCHLNVEAVLGCHRQMRFGCQETFSTDVWQRSCHTRAIGRCLIPLAPFSMYFVVMCWNTFPSVFKKELGGIPKSSVDKCMLYCFEP